MIQRLESLKKMKKPEPLKPAPEGFFSAFIPLQRLSDSMAGNTEALINPEALKLARTTALFSAFIPFSASVIHGLAAQRKPSL